MLMLVYPILWWLIAQILGLAALPIAFRLFRWLPDRGYTLSKALGLLFASYILWLGASTGFLRNDLGGILFAVLAVVGVSAWLFFKGKDGEHGPLWQSLATFLRLNRRLVVTVELLFTIAFIAWCILRAFAPYKIMETGGEKFMEIAFLNGTLNSLRFPPLDPWLSGFAISYYYFGYVMMALLTRLTGAPPGIGFELHDAYLFALTLLGSFGVVYNLVAGRQNTQEKRIASQTTLARQYPAAMTTGKENHGMSRGIHGRHPVYTPPRGQALKYGLLGALFVTVIGNLEGFLEAIHSAGLLPQSFWKWMDIPGLADFPVTGSWFPGGIGGWWGSVWWRASRLFQDRDLFNQPMTSPITEFPYFSFLLGDNHPHKLALPFVLLGIALALNLLKRQVAVGCTRCTQRHHPRSRGTNFESQSNNSQNSAVSDQPATINKQKYPGWNPVGACLDGDWVLFGMYALCLGSLGFLNTWDMPIYIGLTVLAWCAGEYVLHKRLDLALILRTLALAISLVLGAVILYIFFYIGFGSQAGGFLPYIFPPTRLHQYVVMFGLFLFILAWYLVASDEWVHSYLAHTRTGKRKELALDLLKSWAWVVLACLAFTLLTFLVIILGTSLQLVAKGTVDANILQTVFGGMDLKQALQAFVLARLSDPWLFLALTVLLALAIVNVKGEARRAPEVKEHLSAKNIQDGNLDDVESDETTPQKLILESDLFTYLLVIVGVALTFSVEFFYLRDSFGVRMNTVFKFYLQGWVLMACASAYAAWRLLNREPRTEEDRVAKYARTAVPAVPCRICRDHLHTGNLQRTLFWISSTALILAGLVYTVEAGYSRLNGFKGPINLDGASEVARDNPDDWAAILWLRRQAGLDGETRLQNQPGAPRQYPGALASGNTQGLPVILEAPGKSYNYEGRISAFTGLPAVLGWSYHESQWRGNYDEQGKREPDIETIFTTIDEQVMLELLNKWQVKYVVLGGAERRYIEKLCTDVNRHCTMARSLRKFDVALAPVFQQGEITIYEVPGK